MINLAGTLIVPEPAKALVEALLPAHVAATRAEPGCLLFQVVADRCDPTRYLVAQRFATRAAFDAHQARAQSSNWGRATADLVRHYHLTDSSA